jgi:hypothetical protein
MPRNPVMARLEARKVADAVGSGSLTDMMNRKASADMARRRLSATRASHTGMFRTGSDLQMAMPKLRTPGASLVDKGIPWMSATPSSLLNCAAGAVCSMPPIHWCHCW